jgi:replicative DNA helicase
MISIIQRLFCYKGQFGTFQNKKSDYPGNMVITDKHLNEHLSGKRTLGIRLINPENQSVKAGCIDFDLDKSDKNMDLKQLLEEVYEVKDYFTSLGLTTYIEFSGRRGYHLWLFSDTPVSAKVMRTVLKSSELKSPLNLEIFPSGDMMSLEGLGAGQKPIKLPFGIHVSTGRKCGFLTDTVDFSEDGMPVLPEQRELIKDFTQNSAEDITEIYDEMPEMVVAASQNDHENLNFKFEGHPPCIEHLMKSGAPSDLEYNKVNLSLIRYCISKNIVEKEAISMARTVAETTTSHPTEKSVDERVTNFKSALKTAKRNPDKYEFSCGYILSSEQLKKECNKSECPVQKIENFENIKLRPMSDFLELLIEKMFTSPTKSIPTPSKWLNSCLNGGFQGGKLYVLTSPPGNGKTTLAGWLGDYVATNGSTVLLFNYEMSMEELWGTSLARIGGIDSTIITCQDWLYDNKKDAKNEQIKRSIAKAIKDYSDTVASNMHIVEAGPQETIPKIKSFIKSAREKYSIKENEPLLIIIDYLQLLSTGEDKIDNGGNETTRVGRIATSLKQLARETNTAVLAISDISKKAFDESLKTGKLNMSSLRDSFKIAHAADIIMTLQTEVLDINHEKITPLDLSINDSIGNPGHQKKLIELRDSVELKNNERFAKISIVKNRYNDKGEPILIYEKAHHRFREVDLQNIKVNVEEKYLFNL